MSQPATASTAPQGVLVTPATPERKAQVEALVTGILRHMDYPARLEFKDMPDGGIGVAVHFDGQELPGITPGKRSWLVDCIQFLVNKAINRPNVERRWVSLGVNSFPEPRQGKPEKEPAPPVAKSPPQKAPQGGPEAARPPKASAPREAHKPPRRSEVDERSLDVKPDPALGKLFTTLAEKAVATGRLYAVMSLSADDRARALKAAASVKGVSVKAEGEGHWRRVTFTPDKLTPMPSKTQVMPDYDDEEE